MPGRYNDPLEDMPSFKTIWNDGVRTDTSQGGAIRCAKTPARRMFVCPKHRHNLDRNWRPLRTCRYPLHSVARKKLKNDHFINLEMSKNIHGIFGITIPIGSGKHSTTQYFTFSLFWGATIDTVGYCVALGVFCVRGLEIDVHGKVWEILSV